MDADRCAETETDGGGEWTVARWNFAPKTSDSLWEEYLCDWCVRLFGCALDRTVNLTLT